MTTTLKDITIGMLVTVNDETARNPGGYGRITARSPKHKQVHIDSGEFPGQEVTGWYPVENVAPHTPTAIPTYTKRVGEYDPTTNQYPAYVAIDGEAEQLVGSAWSAGGADRLCDDYLFHYYADRHTPEVAAVIAVGMGNDEADERQVVEAMVGALAADLAEIDARNCTPIDPELRIGTEVELTSPNEYHGLGIICAVPTTDRPCYIVAFQCVDGAVRELWPMPGEIRRTVAGDPAPAPPVDDGPEDNFGGFRRRAATRYVTASWNGKNHPDLASIAAQVLLPLAHLEPAVGVDGDYLLIRNRTEIPVPADDHVIVCDLIDALNAVAAQLPVPPDSIGATLHIDGEIYTVTHNGPPRGAQAPGLPNGWMRMPEGDILDTNGMRVSRSKVVPV